MYTRFFVADGNFKADHVRNPRAVEDIWLSEGGGMMAKRENYHQFLREVKNKPTVSKKSHSYAIPDRCPGGSAHTSGMDFY